MINKQDFLKTLYSNEAIKIAFEQVKTDKEVRQIKACVDEIIGKFYDSVVEAYAPIQKNPEIFKNMATNEESSLINNDEKIKITKDK